MFRTFTQLPYNERNLFFRIYQNLLIYISDKKKTMQVQGKTFNCEMETAVEYLWTFWIVDWYLVGNFNKTFL